MGHRLVPVVGNKVIPKIIIDARMVTEIPHGISRYVSYLAQGLEEIFKKNESQGTPPLYEPIFLIQRSLKHTFTSFKTVSLKSSFLDPKEILEIPKVLKSVGASLYHSPSFSSLLKAPCPWLMTLHDLNHLTYGSLSQKLYYQLLLRSFANRARRILTVSKFSQNEIHRWLKIPAERILIVSNVIERQKAPDPLTTQENVLESVLKKYQLTAGNYFLCVSNPKPHKNLNLLIEAYQVFSQNRTGAWPLVVTIQTNSPIPGVLSLGALPEKETSSLLHQAGGVLFPSLYEGFGLPPLEAAVSGIPIAVSRIPPHEEGLADLEPDEVQWVDPKNLEGWVQAFEKIFDSELSSPSQTSQNKILHRFRLEQMGLSMDQIYRDVLTSSL